MCYDSKLYKRTNKMLGGLLKTMEPPRNKVEAYDQQSIRDISKYKEEPLSVRRKRSIPCNRNVPDETRIDNIPVDQLDSLPVIIRGFLRDVESAAFSNTLSTEKKEKLYNDLMRFYKMKIQPQALKKENKEMPSHLFAWKEKQATEVDVMQLYKDGSYDLRLEDKQLQKLVLLALMGDFTGVGSQIRKLMGIGKSH